MPVLRSTLDRTSSRPYRAKCVIEVIADSECSDQTVHPHSLTRAFAARYIFDTVHECSIRLVNALHKVNTPM